jgi:hypothetical protein
VTFGSDSHPTFAIEKIIFPSKDTDQLLKLPVPYGRSMNPKSNGNPM